MEYIYSRCSTEDQNTANQLHAVRGRYPSAEVHEEYISGGSRCKPVLDALASRLVRGDTLIVSELSRLGRKAGHTIPFVDALLERGVTIVSYQENVDLTNDSGYLTAQIHLVIADNARKQISVRTRAALARLKAEGVTLGQPKKDYSALICRVLALRSEGLSNKQVAESVGISLTRLYQLCPARSKKVI